MLRPVLRTAGAQRRLVQLDEASLNGHRRWQREQGDDVDGTQSMGEETGPMTRPVTFITRQGCTLCDEALPGIQGWVDRLGLVMAVVDVDESPDLLERFDHRVPVVLSDEGDVLLEGRWGGLREARMMLRARHG